MHFSNHIQEIKKRLIPSAITLICCSIVGYIFRKQIILILVRPLINNGIHQIIFTSIPEAFMSSVNVSIAFGIIVSSPVIIYNIYQFIAPGLHRRERAVLKLIFVFSPILCLCGLLFVLYIIMPQAIKFFASFEQLNDNFSLVLQPKISEYISITVQMILACSLCFQLPIVVIILFLLKLITIEYLTTKRRWYILLSFIIAGICTPPDILSQFLLAIPLVLLYETAIIICRILVKQS